MTKDAFIDLGKKPSNTLSKEPMDKPYYPTVHLSNISGEYGVGDEVVLRGTIKRATEEEDGQYSCEVKVTGIRSSGSKKKEEGGLGDALDKIEKRKVGVEYED